MKNKKKTEMTIKVAPATYDRIKRISEREQRTYKTTVDRALDVYEGLRGRD